VAGSENRVLISDDVFHFQVRHVQAIIMVMAIVLVGNAIAIVTVTAREV